VLWLQAEDLPRLFAPAGLNHALLEVLAAWPRSLWIVVDGLDRAFASELLQASGALVRGFDVGVLITAQQQEWRRVVDSLVSANAPQPLTAGSTATTITDDTQPSADNHPSPA
jgi:hypothetical protein